MNDNKKELVHGVETEPRPAEQAVNHDARTTADTGKSKKTLIIVTIVCIVLLLSMTGVMAYILLRGNDGRSNAQAETAAETAATQADTERLSDYLGFWHCGAHGDRRELTIHSIDSYYVEFSLWHHQGGEVSHAKARVNGNNAFFEKTDTGEKIAGKLNFCDNIIELCVTESDVGYVAVESVAYDGRHGESYAEADKATATTETTTAPQTAAPSTTIIYKQAPAVNPTTPSIPVSSPYSAYVDVGDDILNLRTGPGVGYSVKMELPNMRWVRVYGYNADYSWSYVADSVTGIMGWVNSYYLSN